MDTKAMKDVAASAGIGFVIGGSIGLDLAVQMQPPPKAAQFIRIVMQRARVPTAFGAMVPVIYHVGNDYKFNSGSVFFSMGGYAAGAAMVYKVKNMPISKSFPQVLTCGLAIGMTSLFLSMEKIGK